MRNFESNRNLAGTLTWRCIVAGAGGLEFKYPARQIKHCRQRLATAAMFLRRSKRKVASPEYFV